MRDEGQRAHACDEARCGRLDVVRDHDVGAKLSLQPADLARESDVGGQLAQRWAAPLRAIRRAPADAVHGKREGLFGLSSVRVTKQLGPTARARQGAQILAEERLRPLGRRKRQRRDVERAQSFELSRLARLAGRPSQPTGVGPQRTAAAARGRPDQRTVSTSPRTT